MRAWKYTSTDGGLEQHLQLHTSNTLPKPTGSQHLIHVQAAALNPVDYKPAEAPFIGRFAVKKSATPGFDLAGTIVTPADGSDLEPGQLVFGACSVNPLLGGALAEYVCAPANLIAPVPKGISPLVAAGVPIAAVTAHDSLMPFIKPGSRVFVNGGSGGVGTFAIQIAKIAGAHVTVSCSSRNADLCRSLGADEVLDYTASPLLEQLRASHSFDCVVDYVFSDPALYYQAHTYTTASAIFAEVAGSPTLAFMRFVMGAMLLPAFLGGGRRRLKIVAGDVKRETLEKLAEWIVEGKIKPVTDRVFPMEDVVEAYKQQKTGRAVGKILIDVAGKGPKA